MLSKNTIKRITRLGQKKYRTADGLFVAEGLKVIQELLDSPLELQELYGVDGAFENNSSCIPITSKELQRISFLSTPQKALAVFKTPVVQPPIDSGLTVALDTVRDPGNLGTIIRLCDWFGVSQLICSHGTVDCYNPKVVQATMGSIARVGVVYTDLAAYLEQSTRPSFGTFMDGQNVYETSLPQEGIIVMGNEANGITAAVAALVNQKLAIPRFGPTKTTESLNVAMATSIFLSEFRRTTTGK